MDGYTFIPIIALFGYLYLLFAFLASKKTKLINGFILLLLVFICWTLGSFGIRIRLYPSITFWFYLSIDALFLLCFAYYEFISSYTFEKQRFLSKVWAIGSLLIIAVNHITGGLFTAPPEATTVAGVTYYVYDIGWPVIIPIFFFVLMFIDCIFMLYRYAKRNYQAKQQIMPLIYGMAFLFAGNTLAATPLFNNFPIDIVSGVINVFLVFFALYKRRLFRLTLLVSKTVCYLISVVMSVFIFSYLVSSYQSFLLKRFTAFESHAVLIIAVTYLIAVFIFYTCLKRFVDRVFTKNEQAQADTIKDFSTAINKTLEVNEILTQLIRVIEQTIQTEKSYVCLLDYSGDFYKIVQSTSPLDEKTLTFQKDNPLVLFLAQVKESVLISDLRRSPVYKAMWEYEKKQLSNLHVQCFLPLMEDDELVGIVLLSNKVKNSPYTRQDLDYLQSLASVSSIAVKNSRLYEKAYWEARTDSLTGLLNRNYFYEILNDIYNKGPEETLSLAFVSMDDFKLYNQLYGTAEGDLALQKAAGIIKGTVGHHGHVARYEGKIFAVILPGLDTLAAINLMESVRKQILDMNKQMRDHAIKILTCSTGVCTIPMGASNTTQLVNNADLALYNAKKNGKNCIRSYTEGPVTEKRKITNVEGAETFKPNIYEEYAATIYALTAAIDAKDHYTFDHSQNVCYYAVELAKAYNLNDDCVEIVKEAALLHDIGKIGIPESILKKPGRLTDEEYQIMKGHVEQSISIIRHLPSLDYVIPAVIGHHERYDGKGYPRGLKGSEIPILARILCVADSFDAMVSKRAYKDPMPLTYAISELEKGAGTQFDPALAMIFIHLLEDGSVQIRTKVKS